MTEINDFSEEIYEKLEDILGINQNARNYWKIADSIPAKNMYLVHYYDEKTREINDDESLDSEDKRILLSLRGVIVDIESSWICCKSFGSTETTIIDEIDPKELSYKDLYGNENSVKTKKIKFQSFYSGPVLRLWKYNNITYMSTHKKISAVNTKWGSNRTFQEIFIDYFGRNVTSVEDIGNILFSKDKATSNFCHALLK